MSDRRPDDQAPLFPRRPLADRAGSASTTQPRDDSAGNGQPPASEGAKAAKDPESGADAATPKPKRAAKSPAKPVSRPVSRQSSTTTPPPEAPAVPQHTDRTGSDQARTAEPAPGPAPGSTPAPTSGGSGSYSGAAVAAGPPTASMPPVGSTSGVASRTVTPTGGPPPAAPVDTPSTTPVPAARPAKPKQTRKARLRMVRVDPWSVMKMSFALSFALAVVTVIAVFIVWSVLDAAGVWTSINSSVASLVEPSAGQSEFDVQDFVGLGRVMGFTLVLAAADIVLLTALATLSAFMYNLAAALLGGLEVTLAEDR